MRRRPTGHDHSLGRLPSQPSLGELPPELYPGQQQAVTTGEYNQQLPEALQAPVPILRNAVFSDQAQAVTSARSILVLNANPNRRYLLIQNNGTGVPATSAAIRIGYGKPATLFSHRLVFDGVYEPEVVPTTAIYLLGESATAQAVVVIEA